MTIAVFEKSIYGYPIVTERDDAGSLVRCLPKADYDAEQRYGMARGAIICLRERAARTYDDMKARCAWGVDYYPSPEEWERDMFEDEELTP